jgi:hypothetical protein
LRDKTETGGIKMITNITNSERPAEVKAIMDSAKKVFFVKGYVIEDEAGEMLSENWQVITQDIDMLLTTVYTVERYAGESFKVNHMIFTPDELDVLAKAAEMWK